MLPIAHAGHWALSLLEAAPLLAVLAVMAGRSVRQRRGSKDDASVGSR
jgi:hypothetical protein